MNTVSILTSHFLPENTACTNRVLALVNELSKSNFVKVYSLTTFGVSEQCENGALGPNVEIFYCLQKEFSKSSFIIRAFNEIRYCYNLVKLKNRDESDLTIVTIPYMFLLPVSAFLLRGKKVLDIRDLVWEYLPENNLFSKFAKKIISMVMVKSIKCFNYIYVTNEVEFANVNSVVQSNSEVSILSNGVSYKSYNLLSGVKFIGNAGFSVLYVGNIGYAQNLQILADAAKYFPDIDFDVVGHGNAFSDLSNYVKSLGITNFKLHGKKEWIDILDFYGRANILYAGLKGNYSSAMPSKLYEYAVTGKPIIYSGIGQAIDFVSSLENSFTVNPTDVNGLVEAISLIREQGEYISDSNRKLIKESFIREISCQRFAERVNEICDI